MDCDIKSDGPSQIQDITGERSLIGARFGHFLDKPLSSIARRVPVSPNAISIAGFAVTSIAALVMARHLILGAVLLLTGAALDLLDGAVARAQGKATDFGAFLDSVLDRYSDAFIFLGLAWNLGSSGDHSGAFLSLGSLVGAVLVSYSRARAEGLGHECKTGIMERPERIVLLAFGIFAGLVVEMLWVMFVLTHLTVIQRVLHLRRQTRQGSSR